MSAATRRLLDGGRWLFQHGPIDCVVGAEGESAAVTAALDHAWRRFGTLLDELVAELPLLRTDLSSLSGRVLAPRGEVARRMVAACRVHAEDGVFITAMAAVAGGVAQTLIASFHRPGIVRAHVNNGGDVALHLAPGASFDVGVVDDPARRGAASLLAGRFVIDAGSPVRGLATSGWRGRSLSRGIADAATVLAATASAADAAATVIANAVDVAAPGIVRRPADQVRDDSDLGGRLVTVDVPVLPEADVRQALAAGAAVARAQLSLGRVIAAVILLQGRVEVIGDPGQLQRVVPTGRPVPIHHQSLPMEPVAC